MQLVSYPRTFFCVAQHAPVELTPKAQERLRLLKAWEELMAGGMSAAARAGILSVSRASLYRWRKRVSEHGLQGLEEGSRRSKRVRRAEWSQGLAESVRRLRQKYPRWGKEILTVLLRRTGQQTSVSTMGRTLGWLKVRGLLHEPHRGLGDGPETTGAAPVCPAQAPRTSWGMFLSGPFVPKAFSELLTSIVHPGRSYRDRLSPWCMRGPFVDPAAPGRHLVQMGAGGLGLFWAGAPPVVSSKPFSAHDGFIQHWRAHRA